MAHDLAERLSDQDQIRHTSLISPRSTLTPNFPQSGKNSVDLMTIGKPRPPGRKSHSSPHILLSRYHSVHGDHDFAYLLSTVGWRKYNVVLSNSSTIHESLAALASYVYCVVYITRHEWIHSSRSEATMRLRTRTDWVLSDHQAAHGDGGKRADFAIPMWRKYTFTFPPDSL